jgi:hypothetical protein
MRVTVSQATAAGRLHRLLSDIRQQPPNQNIVQAWAEVLRIPVNRRAELFRICSLVVAPPDEIVRSASRSGDELLPAVAVVGGAGQGRGDHNVDCEGSHVGRPDYAADRERSAELSPARFEVVAEQ